MYDGHMAVRVVSDGPAEVLTVNCDRCCRTLEFTFEDVKPHRTDSDMDAIERKGLYLTCPRSSCDERTWVGTDQADARKRCPVRTPARRGD